MNPELYYRCGLVRKEFGGYIEIEHYHGDMLHEDAVHLNCGRRAFSYLIKSKCIKNVWLPKLMCRSVEEPFEKEACCIKQYSVGMDFLPMIDDIPFDDWIVLINYYGQINNKIISELSLKHPHLIVDNTQAYFQTPISGLDTIYSCRKFFGVSDGAILYSDKEYSEKLEEDESFERMLFLMGRFERTASEFYKLYVNNNELFNNQPIKKMSKLTENILHGIDYDYVCSRRSENYKYLDERLKNINRLKLSIPDGPFMYPLYIENGKVIRKRLQDIKVYIPSLWPDVFDICKECDLEYDMAANILPIPVDQRYELEDMKYIVSEVLKCLD